MSTVNPFANVASEAAKYEDQTQVQEITSRVPEAGKTVGRLIEYIELGPQPQEYQGKKKPDHEEVRITFELLHPKKNVHEYDGTTFTDTISWRGPKKFTSKSGFYKLMQQMKYGRDDIVHMAQMLGEAFIITVFHNEVEKDGKKRVYANLFKDQMCKIESPRVEDPLTGDVKMVPVPDATREIRCFIWAQPTIECWNSIFIDGTYTIKVDGKEVEKSKNWMQDTIMAGPAFPESATCAMLSGAGQLPGQDQLAAAGLGAVPKESVSDDLDLDAMAAGAAQKAAGGTENPKPTQTAPEEKKTSPAPSQAQAAGNGPAQGASASTEAPSADDALAALGL